MSLDECFEKRLLRRGRPDVLKSKRALEMSGQYVTSVEILVYISILMFVSPI